MTKYLIRRILHGILSIIAVVALVMLLIYSLMNRQLIFQSDPLYAKKLNNDKTAYQLSRWEQYGYLDYVEFSDYMRSLLNKGDIDQDTFDTAVYPRDGEVKSKLTQQYVDAFTELYEGKGYTVEALAPVTYSSSSSKIAPGGNARLFAYKDDPLILRLGKYFARLFSVDNIHHVKDDAGLIGKRGLTFTLYDPVYTETAEDGSEIRHFSPAIIGNGTKYKYLLYTDNHFPYVHQNLLKIRLGMSYAVNAGYDVFETMTVSQGSFDPQMLTYPTGLREMTSDDLHSAMYNQGSLEKNKLQAGSRYVDDYTNVSTLKSGHSKVGYSFMIGIIATVMAYVLGVPIGIWMAMKKDKVVDKIGTLYIVFIIAVPSLAYIFMFKAIGSAAGLPATFDLDSKSKLMYVLPIVSLALPQIGVLMKWIRRYMIDQMNSDYVKFARSGGLSEREIFSKHILKNAIIPIVQGIPASVLGAMVGAIITERVYVVPGAGNLLTTAIGAYDNGVIVGLTLFYALLSVTSIILGDVLMSMVDPRISFTTKAR